VGGTTCIRGASATSARGGEVAFEARALLGGERLAGVALAAREQLRNLRRHLRRPAGPAVHRRLAGLREVGGHGAAADDLDAGELAAVDLVAADVVVVAMGVHQVAHRLRGELSQRGDRRFGGRRRQVGVHHQHVVVAHHEQDVGVEEEAGGLGADEGMDAGGEGLDGEAGGGRSRSSGRRDEAKGKGKGGQGGSARRHRDLRVAAMSAAAA
jgi:hypothetical protein